MNNEPPPKMKSPLDLNRDGCNNLADASMRILHEWLRNAVVHRHLVTLTVCHTVSQTESLQLHFKQLCNYVYAVRVTLHQHCGDYASIDAIRHPQHDCTTSELWHQHASQSNAFFGTNKNNEGRFGTWQQNCREHYGDFAMVGVIFFTFTTSPQRISPGETISCDANTVPKGLNAGSCIKCPTIAQGL